MKINRIPAFVLQNPAARAGPRLSNTKPETVRRDGSNEVTWAFNESLSALLFTHHRFFLRILNRSIALAARARGRFANLHCSIAWISWLLERFLGANPPRVLCACCSSVRGQGKGPSRVPRRLLATTPAAPWHHKRPQAKTMADGRVLQHPIGATHLGMPTGARWPRGPGSTVLSCPISLLGLKDANSGR